MFFCFHFLITQEPILRATQYLPGIVKLQHQLYELYHRKLYLVEANQITITEFVNDLESGIIIMFILCKPNIHNFLDSEREEFQCNLQCVKSAWELVKNRVYEFGEYKIYKH